MRGPYWRRGLRREGLHRTYVASYYDAVLSPPQFLIQAVLFRCQNLDELLPPNFVAFVLMKWMFDLIGVTLTAVLLNQSVDAKRTLKKTTNIHKCMPISATLYDDIADFHIMQVTFDSC